MGSKVTLGNVLLEHVSSFEVNESILEMSNTAKITIPRNYSELNGKSILEQFKAGDPVTIDAGYDDELEREFTGYIREIESDYPLIIHCDDETYPLRQTDYVMSWKSVTLKQVLSEIIPGTIQTEAPDVNLGKFQINHESAFQVLQRIKDKHGLYSRLQNGVLKLGLRDLVSTTDVIQVHTYILNPERQVSNLVKENNLKYKRKEDYKLRVTVTSITPDGKRMSSTVGDTTNEASIINVTYPGSYTEAELRQFATSIYNKRTYDGYTGTITGFGLPRTHAGDSLRIQDDQEPERAGKYLIEKVAINYDSSNGFSRQNTLSYKLK
jgi:hypothetical protein